MHIGHRYKDKNQNNITNIPLPMDKNSTLISQNSQTQVKNETVSMPAKKTIAFIKQFARVYSPVNTSIRENAAIILN